MHLLNDKSEEPLTFFGRLDSLIDTLPVPLLSSGAQTLFLLSLDNRANQLGRLKSQSKRIGYDAVQYF